MKKICAYKLEYPHAKVVGKKIPTWVLLTPTDVPSVDGIDMGTVTKEGFF